MARKRRLHKRYGRTARRNPESSSITRGASMLLSELGEFVGPAFAAFAGTRMLTRMASVQIARRKPAWAKHAGAIASIGSFLAAWFGAHRVKFLEKHSTPIVVGSAIAAAQSIIQLYVPSLGWILSDSSPEISTEAASAGQIQQTTAQQLAAAKLQPVNEDPGWYTYDDSFDAGRYAKQTGAPAPAPSAGVPQKQAEEDLLADLQLDDNMGVFSN